MTPFASVAMLEKLALLKIALCRAPVLGKDSWRRTSVMLLAVPATVLVHILCIRSSCSFLDFVE
jgi:hypothetical protein